MGTQEYISQSNLSNKVRSKNLEISHTKWKHTTRKHGYGHYGFKSLTMKDTAKVFKSASPIRS